MEADLKRQAILWGHLLITLPAIAPMPLVVLFHRYLFLPGWPYYITIAGALGYQWYAAAMPRWRRAMVSKGLPETEVEEIAREGGLVIPGADVVGLFALHSTAAALCATYLNLSVTGVFVRRVLPLTGSPAPAYAADFYLQHFELANLIPAFVLGYLISIKFPKLGSFAWVLPTVVICYKLATFVDPNVSVLTGGHPWQRFSYYFVIQELMPSFNNLRGSDPLRVVEQITVVASFYSSIAYSAGAFAMKTKVLQRIAASVSRESESGVIEPAEAGVAVIASDSTKQPTE